MTIHETLSFARWMTSGRLFDDHGRSVVDVMAQLQRSPPPPAVSASGNSRRFVHPPSVSGIANCRRCCRPMRFHAYGRGSPDPLPRAIDLTAPTFLVGPGPGCLKSYTAGMNHPPKHHRSYRHTPWCSLARRRWQLRSEDIRSRGLKTVTFRVSTGIRKHNLPRLKTSR